MTLPTLTDAELSVCPREEEGSPAKEYQLGDWSRAIPTRLDIFKDNTWRVIEKTSNISEEGAALWKVIYRGTVKGNTLTVTYGDHTSLRKLVKTAIGNHVKVIPKGGFRA
jgi:hypothetical protein